MSDLLSERRESHERALRADAAGWRIV